MTQKIRVFGLALKPWRFGVMAACGLMFALTAGGAWFPIAHVGGRPLDLLFSAQGVTFALLIGATLFLYLGVRNGRPAWKEPTAVFSLAVLGSYAGRQLLPLVLGWCW
jgi:threonine/homoserine efflux transporter RhtA